MSVYYAISLLFLLSAAGAWFAEKNEWLALVLFGTAFAVLGVKNIVRRDDYSLVYNLALMSIFYVKAFISYRKGRTRV